MRTRDLPLVKTIKKCKGLTPRRKLRAIERIGKINRDKKLRIKCNFVDDVSRLIDAFMWCCTPWGHEYWDRIDDTLEREQT